MPEKVNDVAFTSPLTPNDWLNITFIATRVVAILGYPPVSMSVETMGTPEMLWADPEDETISAVLDFAYNPDQPRSSKPCLHIASTVGEGATLALIGLCSLRDAVWQIMPDREIDNSEIFEEDDKSLS